MLLFKNMVILNQNVIIYKMFSQVLYRFNELHKQALEFSSRLAQTRIMMAGAKFNSHDSGDSW